MGHFIFISLYFAPVQKSTVRFLPIFILIAFSHFGCSKPKGFEFRELRNLSISTIGFQKSTVALDLVYYNPNNFGVTLTNVSADVYLEKKLLGRYVLDTSMFIPKQSEFILPSKMEVDMRNLLKNATQVLFAQELLLEVNGQARAGKAGIYINVPINYSGKHKLPIF